MTRFECKTCGHSEMVDPYQRIPICHDALMVEVQEAEDPRETMRRMPNRQKDRALPFGREISIAEAMALANEELDQENITDWIGDYS